MSRLAVLVPLLVVCGCTSYRFDLIRPDDGAGPLPSGRQRRFDVNLLGYATG